MLLQIFLATEKRSAEIDCSVANTVEIYYAKTARYAMHKVAAMVGSEALAAEIVQDVFLKLWQKRPVFTHERELYAWIYRSAHRAGIDYLRSGKSKWETKSLEPSHELLAAFEIDWVSQQDILQKCLRKLSKRQAEILGYLAMDGMTQEEVAEVLNLSRKTIQREMKKIKPKLLSILECP